MRDTCSDCRKPLTDPASQERGRGPKCAARYAGHQARRAPRRHPPPAASPAAGRRTAARIPGPGPRPYD